MTYITGSQSTPQKTSNYATDRHLTKSGVYDARCTLSCSGHHINWWHNISKYIDYYMNLFGKIISINNILSTSAAFMLWLYYSICSLTPFQDPHLNVGLKTYRNSKIQFKTDFKKILNSVFLPLQCSVWNDKFVSKTKICAATTKAPTDKRLQVVQCSPFHVVHEFLKSKTISQKWRLIFQRSDCWNCFPINPQLYKAISLYLENIVCEKWSAMQKSGCEKICFTP